ncbi:uncharacterized protein LOC34620085 [Cyclospora cayetanensis]|uniref:Uncharacterized protein LOC34620085 n=1 Tax=Cyclospora cayetanensis TaxID=88456 RepID=A0A6P5WEC3_9EIME|nr:uncharacterized protein LOC34620085 [Cyclospora cayetanensis]
MTRAAALAGFIALAAGQGLALPMETTPHMEWEEAAAEAQRAAAASVDEAISGMTTQGMSIPMSRMMSTTETTPQQGAVQEAVLDAIMKEVQTIIKNTLTVPGWDTMESATDTVKQIVEKVRERLTTSMNETETGRATMNTATALRGVTNDFLKEIMVQEAVIETLWAVLRDSQNRPWITNEQQAMHVAATQAVHGFLSRMQERLRSTGFTEEEITKMLPQSKTCAKEGPTGMFDTCPERNLGRKGSGGYGYGYAYPAYVGTAYPAYYSRAYPAYYGYSHPYAYDWGYPLHGAVWGPSYAYGWRSPYYARSYGWLRRLGENTTPESSMPPMGPPMTPEMGAPMTPEEAGISPMNTKPEMSPMSTAEAMTGRSLYHNWGHGYGYGYWGPHYHGWYGSSYPYYGHRYSPWAWGSPYFWRRLEVPDLSPAKTYSSTGPSPKITENTQSNSSTGTTTFRRVGETRMPQGQNTYYMQTSGTPVYTETTGMDTTPTGWETTYN